MSQHTVICVDAYGGTQADVGMVTRDQAAQVISELKAWIDTPDGPDWSTSMQRFRCLRH